MNFKPLYDRVVIEPMADEEDAKLGILLPKSSQDKQQIGVVVAVGDGENFDGVESKMKIEVGNKIMFEKYAGTELKLEGKTYVVLRQIDIIGVFDD